MFRAASLCFFRGKDGADVDHLGLLAVVGKEIVRKGVQHECSVHSCHNGHGGFLHSGDQHHEDQAGEQDRGADLTAEQGTVQHLLFAKIQTDGDELEALLHHEQADEPDQKRIPESQTHDQRELGHLVGNGIQELAHVGDHIEFARNVAVDHVGHAGQGQNTGSEVVVTGFHGVEVDRNVNRDQRQTEHTEKIRYG